MFRIDDATAGTSLPAPESAGTEGYWVEGNPATGTPATKIRGSWLNMIQEELCSILAAAGIARSKTTYNQVNQALQKLYSPVIGSARNVSMSVSAASATATLTADEIVVGSALGGQKYMLSNFNKTINLAGANGAGAMDTGSAPVSGYVALYAIYNPTTQTAALLSTNATSAVAPNVYGGVNMPSGYTASALVSVWPTNASSQFIAANQRDRTVCRPIQAIYGEAVTRASYTQFGAASVIPPNAKGISGTFALSSSSSSNTNLWIAGDAAGSGEQGFGITGTGSLGSFARVALSIPQNFFVKSTTAVGTPGFNLAMSAYDF